MSTGLAAAERALERGDYGLCLRLLEPLAEACPITDPQGAAIRMVMVTAWMGQGDERKAISKYLEKNDVSPLTGEKLAHKSQDVTLYRVRGGVVDPSAFWLSRWPLLAASPSAAALL